MSLICIISSYIAQCLYANATSLFSSCNRNRDNNAIPYSHTNPNINANLAANIINSYRHANHHTNL